MPRRLLTIFFNLIIAIVLVPLSWISYVELSKLLGLRAVPVEVAGTGSMYPSLYWDESQGGPEKAASDGIAEFRSSPRMYRYFPGLTLSSQTYLKSQLAYGDMVAFTSAKTREILSSEGKNPNLGFIKRLIAMPGDTIELRDGFVLRNGVPLEEPYTRASRSTYGGTTLKECTVVTVPPQTYFVLGDNRKVSSDSRFELGFVQDSDIQFYLPLHKQIEYQKLWRDVSQDQAMSGTSTLNSAEFYAKLSPLKRHPKLETSAKYRAEALLKNENTALDFKTAMTKAGYENPLGAEFVTYGHYTASELWENLMNDHETRRYLTKEDYTDLGVFSLVADVAGCPTQIVVGHLGGYVPATYSPEVTESYLTAKNNLAEAIPSWEAAVGAPGVDQAQLSELLNLLRLRQQLINDVLDVISKRQWINNSLQARLDQDEKTNARITELVKALNSP